MRGLMGSFVTEKICIQKSAGKNIQCLLSSLDTLTLFRLILSWCIFILLCSRVCPWSCWWPVSFCWWRLVPTLMLQGVAGHTSKPDASCVAHECESGLSHARLLGPSQWASGTSRRAFHNLIITLTSPTNLTTSHHMILLAMEIHSSLFSKVRDP